MAGRALDQDTTGQNLGFHETDGAFSAGGQVAVLRDVRLGFALGYDHSDIDSSAGASSKGDRVNVGGVAKYNSGPLLLAAAVSAGWGSYDIDRNINFRGLNTIARGESDIDYVAARLHASYVVGRDGWYLKPLIDATLTDLDLGNTRETANGVANLIVNGRNESIFSVSPAIEAGTEFFLSNQTQVRPFAKAGLTWHDDDDFALDASFAAAAPGVAPFVINSKFDKVLADATAGVDLIAATGTVMRFQYDGQFGESIRQSSVSIKGSVRF